MGETFESSSHLIMLKWILKAYYAWKPQLCFQTWWIWLKNSNCQKWIDSEMDVSGNSGFSPKSSILIRVFDYIHHPSWVFSPYFWTHPKCFFGNFGCRSFVRQELSTSCSRIDAYSSQGMPSDVRVEAEVCYLQFMAKRSKGFCWYILLLG